MIRNIKLQGFALVSVLLITTISTIFALSAIKENHLQERISGNQAKEVNARAMAEKGIFESYDFIKLQQSENATVAEIIANLNGVMSGEDQFGGYTITAQASTSVNGLLLISEGKYQGATAFLKSEIETIKGQGASPGGAIVACEGISLTAGGLIDSFDSREGAYDSSNANNNADVVTIDGDINITGGTNLKGDLRVNGDVTQKGSANIGGDLSASGDVTMAQGNVKGNISSGNDVSLTGGTVGDIATENSGNVSALGSLKLANGSERTVNALGKGKVNANKGLIKPDWLNADNFSDNIQTSGATSPTMAANKCNEKDIATALPKVDINSSNTNSNMATPHGGKLAELTFGESKAQIFDTNNTTNELVSVSPSSQTSSLWEGEKDVYVFDDFKMNNTMITIEGDVTIMVKGDLITTGGGTGFRFNEGDTDSSLTILIEGKLDIGSSTKIFENATVDSVNQKVPLTVYSSFDSSGSNASENAIYLNGAGSMYGKIYAPLGNVEYAASGEMMGSLEGKNVAISGAGSIHYDEALQFIDDGGTSSDDAVTFSSIYYHYPE